MKGLTPAARQQIRVLLSKGFDSDQVKRHLSDTMLRTARAQGIDPVRAGVILRRWWNEVDTQAAQLGGH